MASFKGDVGYTVRFDDPDDDRDDAESWLLDSYEQIGNERRRWLDENYDALDDLHHIFLETGRTLFGNEFYCGGFHSFVEFIFKYR